MRMLLTFFSLVWLLLGVALLALLLMLPDMLPAVAPPAVPGPEQAPPPSPSLYRQASEAIWFPWLAVTGWTLLFLIPSLGLAGLGAVLDRLQRLEARVPAPAEAPRRDRPEAGRKRPVIEKVEPTIGKF